MVAHYGVTAASAPQPAPTPQAQPATAAKPITQAAVTSVNPEPAPSRATAASRLPEVKPATTELSFGTKLWQFTWAKQHELLSELRS